MAEPLKNAIDDSYLLKLGREISRYQKDFSPTAFRNECLGKDWDDLALKERITRITQSLENHLPGTFKQKIATLKKVAPQFTGYKAFYFPEFVSTFGMSEKDRQTSLEAMKTFTRYSSSEFAVRPFIQKNPKEMMEWMKSLAESNNEDERRLASEGCRPRLPWSFNLKEFIDDPSPIFPILEKLANDPSLYVRRSVANNLNDISKDHPKKVLSWIKKLVKKNKSSETLWIAHQSLRTLLKKGNSEALKILGFSDQPPVKASPLKLSSTHLKLGETLEFEMSFENTSKKDVPLLVDFIFHFRKKSGEVNPKVFRWRKFVLKAGEKKNLTKKHPFKDLSTREHVEGEQFLQVQYNGQLTTKKKFLLEAKKAKKKKKTSKKSKKKKS